MRTRGATTAKTATGDKGEAVQDDNTTTDRLAELRRACATWIGSAARTVRAWTSRNTAELLATGGAAAVTTGTGQMHGSAGWIVGGLFLLAGGVAVAKSRGSRR